MIPLYFPCDKEVLHHQHIHLRTEKAIEGFLRATHYWFIFVEGSIQNDGSGSQGAEFRDQRLVIRGWSDGGMRFALELIDKRRGLTEPFEALLRN